jgi:hypothetical protein
MMKCHLSRDITSEKQMICWRCSNMVYLESGGGCNFRFVVPIRCSVGT